jgi:hypothetical protein
MGREDDYIRWSGKLIIAEYFVVLSQHSSGNTGENHEKSVKTAGDPTEIGTAVFRTQVRCFTAVIAYSMCVCVCVASTWKLVPRFRGPNIAMKKQVEIIPWSGVLHSSAEEILHLHNPKVHYRLHKSSILGQMNPVHNLAPYLFMIAFNIIHPSKHKLHKWYVPFRFSD